MKKKVFLCLLVFICLLTVGCGKEKDKDKVVGGYEIDLTTKQAHIEEYELNIFKEIKKDKYKDLEVVALLGEQVVAGKNYIFLCKDNKEYKIVTIYKDLEEKVKVTSVKDFNPTKYANEKFEYNKNNLDGGIQVIIPPKGVELDEKVNTIFTTAMEKEKSGEYKPIGVVGHQVVSGTNYLVLCYGSINIEEPNTGIYMITLYEDLKGTSEVVSIAYIDISELLK